MNDGEMRQKQGPPDLNYPMRRPFELYEDLKRNDKADAKFLKWDKTEKKYKTEGDKKFKVYDDLNMSAGKAGQRGIVEWFPYQLRWVVVQWTRVDKCYAKITSGLSESGGVSAALWKQDKDSGAVSVGTDTVTVYGPLVGSAKALPSGTLIWIEVNTDSGLLNAISAKDCAT